ncbi:class I SAM-dependent DNA methyltransferase [Actinomadura rayongensis]|uniref:Methyltransferase domain-containing protein n=1 Tax=Actinomadura rayongensis TaxID=1429076 RepID=A0A6I4W1Y5_9ACTN|nr:SAM-dependent methyltransferase [Actinomadura rayongensis]MXQ62485.1 methyltransferase domain-containing protein [Actinomadura rayongensis]
MDPAYFDAMYAASDDPWGMASRWYERRKYAVTLALLPRPRYASAFEAGCSVGVLTAALAARCDRLLACDLSPAAVAAASARAPGARVERRVLPDEWPDGRFDLIVLSEVLYYFGDDDLARVLDRAVAALEPGGTLLAVHWRHRVPEYPKTGDEVHAALAATPLRPLAAHREEDFRAEAFTVGRPVSPAAAEGLV